MKLKAAALILPLALGLLAVPVPAEAEKPGKVPRVGYIGGSPPSRVAHLHNAFRQGLRELGYVEGQNIIIEWRSARGRNERLPDLAAELVRLNVDVIVTSHDQTTKVVQQATTTIPVVMAFSADPIGAGFVASLARPGGNITGLSGVLLELAGKRLELLNEVIPGLSRVALLYRPDDTPLTARHVREFEAVAQKLGLTLQRFEVRDPNELEEVFSAVTRERPGAVMVGLQPFTFRHRQRIMDLAAVNRLPTMSGLGVFVKAGGLMSYGVSFRDLWRRAATYVDKILKGANPADLPVEQPTKFDLVINLKTANALGLTIPPSVLIRADRVIK